MTSRRRYDEKERKKRKKKKGKRRAERKLLEESLFSSKPREGRSEFCVEGGMRLPSLIDKLNSYDPSSCDRTSEQKRQRRRRRVRERRELERKTASEGDLTRVRQVAEPISSAYISPRSPRVRGKNFRRKPDLSPKIPLPGVVKLRCTAQQAFRGMGEVGCEHVKERLGSEMKKKQAQLWSTRKRAQLFLKPADGPAANNKSIESQAMAASTTSHIFAAYHLGVLFVPGSDRSAAAWSGDRMLAARVRQAQKARKQARKQARKKDEELQLD